MFISNIFAHHFNVTHIWLWHRTWTDIRPHNWHMHTAKNSHTVNEMLKMEKVYIESDHSIKTTHFCCVFFTFSSNAFPNIHRIDFRSIFMVCFYLDLSTLKWRITSFKLTLMSSIHLFLSKRAACKNRSVDVTSEQNKSKIHS